MKNFTFLIATIALFVLNLSLASDSVKINQTGTVFENVKSSTLKNVVTVDFEDGTQKKFKSKDVTVTPGETVWLADQPKEEPGFFSRMMGSSESSDAKQDESKSNPATGETASKEESSTPYLAEGIFGAVALLFLLLP
jgi:hypothetical protein